ncbi:MAG: DoxX-like family protein [Paucibacter sp.]|nr:DoxX-like family protein [Roseateles sp.]
MALNTKTRTVARASLITVWTGAALTSLPGLGSQGDALLRAASVPQFWHGPLMLAGAGLDALCALLLWRSHRRGVYKLCGAAMLGMSLFATLLLPRLWLDPLGCLLKNLPIAALLFLLHEDAPA